MDDEGSIQLSIIDVSDELVDSGGKTRANSEVNFQGFSR